MTRSSIRFAMCLVPVLAASCRRAGGLTDAGTSGPIAAAMNDVSILFPLPSSAADIDNLLPPSAAGDQGELLPGALYTALEGDAGFPQELAAYAELRVVAMRIDPCFASLAPDPNGVGCTAQLRLVFQQVTWNPGGAFAFDSAVHAFYDLSRADFLALARALVELRIVNANGQDAGSLAPHPIMVQQGLAGAMCQGVEELVLQYAGENNLVRLAQLIPLDNELEEIWNMSAFDVGDGGTGVTPRTIPTLVTEDGGGVYLEGLGGAVRQEGPDGGPGFLFVQFNRTTSADDFSAVDEGDPQSVSSSARQAAFDGLVRIENPGDNSASTIDCASCHLATPTEKLVFLPLFSLDDATSPLAFQPDGASVIANDLTPTFNTNGAQFNIHAFSYFGTAPGISQRTVNETAAVVEYLNALPQ
jgi:hypothetical protein